MNYRALSLADCVVERNRLACRLFLTIQGPLTAITYESQPVAMTIE